MRDLGRLKICLTYKIYVTRFNKAREFNLGHPISTVSQSVFILYTFHIETWACTVHVFWFVSHRGSSSGVSDESRGLETCTNYSDNLLGKWPYTQQQLFKVKLRFVIYNKTSVLNKVDVLGERCHKFMCKHRLMVISIDNLGTSCDQGGVIRR